MFGAKKVIVGCWMLDVGAKEAAATNSLVKVFLQQRPKPTKLGAPRKMFYSKKSELKKS